MNIAGRDKLAEGREAEIFEWDGGAVLKLFRAGAEGIEREAASLTAIAPVGGPAPRLLGRVEVDRRAGLVIERIGGRDMLAILARTPTRIVGEALRLADTHAAIHRIAGPPELPETKEFLRSRISLAPLSDMLRSFAIAQVDGLPTGDRLLHGDFHPGNVLVAGKRASVIDWSGASRGHPSIDVARTKLLLDLGEPLAPSRWMRVVISVGRGAFSRLYSRRYARAAPVDRGVISRAMPVMAAVRLAEGIPEEEAMLTGIVAAARQASEG